MEKENHWKKVDFNTMDLLKICLSHVAGLQKVRVLDAGFIGEIPNDTSMDDDASSSNMSVINLGKKKFPKSVSMAIVIQKEIFPGMFSEKNIEVVCSIFKPQCEDCKRAFTPHLWRSIVQVRQKNGNRVVDKIASKRTML